MIRQIYGKKVGMTQVFDEEGNLLPVTLIEVEPVYLLEKVEYPNRTMAKIGCFKIEEKKVGKLKRPLKGYFNKLGVGPYKLIREVEWEESAVAEEQIQQESKDAKPVQEEPQADSVKAVDPRQMGVEIFEAGEKVDVRAKTKGRGFTGGMKRYGWSGQPGAHGSTTHRRIGSAGASAYPSKIIKGIHMPGHMGNSFRTIKNLKILKIDQDKGFILIRGSIPGSRGTIVCLKKSR
jgi:large subunit ribosomal protein L3